MYQFREYAAAGGLMNYGIDLPIAVLLDPNQLDIEVELREAEAAGRALGRQILIVKATSDREFKAAFATIVQAGADARRQSSLHQPPSAVRRAGGPPRVTRELSDA
jgi:hypothetical protein